MSLTNLSAACKDALRIFAERGALAQTKRVQELELELYHARVPSLRVAMSRFNRTLDKEACCCHGCWQRNPEDFDEEPPYDAGECKLVPAWNQFLESAGISVSVGRKMPAYLTPDHCDSDAALHVAHPDRWDWSGFAWGKPLTHLTHDPRRAMWDAILKRIESKSWKTIAWNGVVEECQDNCSFGDDCADAMTYDGSRCKCKRCDCGVWLPECYYQIHHGCMNCAMAI